MSNPIKEKIRHGEPIIGTVAHLGGANSIECLGSTGLDFVVIDMEHGPFSVQDTLDYIRAAECGGITAVVRVPDYTRPSLHRVINCGAKGIVIPCMENLEEVRLLLEQVRMFPAGKHCFPYARNSGWSQKSAGRLMDFYQEVNDDVLVIPQCETVGFLNHIDEIMSMDGIDGVFFGPYDLSTDMGISGQFEHPDFLKARQKIIDACKRNHKPGISFSPNIEAAKKNLADGFAGVAISIDAVEFIRVFQSIVNSIKNG